MICDLAETYGIFDYKALRPDLVATLVIGLRPDSRVMMHLAKAKLNFQQTMMALIFDALQVIAFNQGHKKHAKKPESLYKKLTTEPKKDELMSFDSPEAYEAWRKEHIWQTQLQPHMSR